MGKSLNDLALKDEPLPHGGEMLDNLPIFGQFNPPPQPGAMQFKLPPDLTQIWDTFEVEKNGKKDTRVVADFDANAPLIITLSPGNKYTGEPFQTRLNNNERARGKDRVLLSDLDYLIFAIEGPQPRPKSNPAYIQKIRTFGGREFAGDMRWSWRCSEGRVRRVKDDAGNTVEDPNGTKGCGEAFYQEDITKLPDGTYPLEAQCTCGAILRAFGNIDNIRKPK